MTTKHTPGPWQAKQIGNEGMIGPVTPPDQAAAKRTTAANARLIAVAPALLEALEAMIEHIDPEHCGGCHAAYIQARATIHRAKGE